jgi:hypothetical protein
MTRQSERAPNRNAVMDQVRDALQDSEGWWVEDALVRFRFLEIEFGYELSAVSMHFRGNNHLARRRREPVPGMRARRSDSWLRVTTADPEPIWVPSLLKGARSGG